MADPDVRHDTFTAARAAVTAASSALAHAERVCARALQDYLDATIPGGFAWSCSCDASWYGLRATYTRIGAECVLREIGLDESSGGWQAWAVYADRPSSRAGSPDPALHADSAPTPREALALLLDEVRRCRRRARLDSVRTDLDGLALTLTAMTGAAP